MKKILPGLWLILLSIQLSAQNVGINTTTPEAVLDVNGDVIFRTGDLVVADGITLALDVTSTKFSYYRVAGPVADFILAGISAGQDGRLLTLFNRSGFSMQLNNEDPSAAVADQIVTGTNADVIIPHKGIINLQYDATEQKWIVKSSSKGGATIAPGGLWDISGSDIFNTNAGNVGIGINTPLAPLHIKNDNQALRIQGSTPYISFYDNAGVTLKGFIQQFNNNLYLGTPGGNTTGVMEFYLNNSSKMTILPNGNVGIGTNAPLDKFAVQTFGYGLTHAAGTATIGTWIGNFQGTTTVMFGTKSAHDLNFFTANSLSQMTLAQNGNFGVGTQTPTEKLTVQTPNDSYGISHRGAGGNVIATFIGGSSAGVGTFSNTNMRIFCNGASAIFIASGSNNVGIGINFPTYKLEVNGNIRSKEVLVESVNWPDYVFNKNYKLPLLSDIEKFIQQNNHLPNMPSAGEIETKGLRLGDTQKKMMEKIEELTLYMIQANKQISELQKEVEKLKSTNQ
jgi:hypothetical protein